LIAYYQGGWLTEEMSLKTYRAELYVTLDSNVNIPGKDGSHHLSFQGKVDGDYYFYNSDRTEGKIWGQECSDRVCQEVGESEKWKR